jgi:O-antigen ligase
MRLRQSIGLASSDLSWIAYSVIVSAVAVHLGITASQTGLGAPVLTLTCLGIMSLVLVPRFPAVALGTFVLAAYGLPRYMDRFTGVLTLNLLNWISVLAIIGWAIWAVRVRANLRIKNWLTLTMSTFIVWVGVTMLAAWTRGEWIGYYPRHHPEQYFQGMALFLIAAHTLGQRTPAWWFLLLLCFLPSLQAVQLGSKIYLDNDTPLLSAIIFPAALLGAASAPHLAQRMVFGLLAVNMLRIITVAQNRGAAVAFACALTIVWWNSRYRLRIALIGIPAILVGASLLVPQGYVERFRALWNPEASHWTESLNLAPARGRLTLWDTAIRMVADRPIVGVGAGNYPHATANYARMKSRQPAHNNVLDVAAEMGIPGVALYLALFVGAVFALQGVIRRARSEWPEPIARIVQAALVAYLGGGLFMSRQDMQLAYLLLGWVVALQLQVRDREEGRARRPGDGVLGPMSPDLLRERLRRE